ncbi:EAL domain-containing protein [Alkalisalibacterium limincola]|uniref:EAL domain-containing protein n=1 Tax=Alkalisalibacterium limincola TaxID=2699169 RepID=UPI00164FEB5B|nr:EAL domain-containing protein [Alkalisalibacterium limincola]
MLIRLRDEDGSLVPPMAFIPAAERYGIMPAIDRWVITRALAYLEQQNQARGERIQLSINLSGATLNDEGFAPFVEEILKRTDVDPEQIVFEVTETSALVNLTATARLLARLKAAGVSFALDDFGSGMSSLGYLKHLPVDYLKIDGLFIRNIATDRVDCAMVEAIAKVASVMGIQTVAEFVETQDVMDLLAGIGIDFAQGYGVHVPEPLDTPSIMTYLDAS